EAWARSPRKRRGGAERRKAHRNNPRVRGAGHPLRSGCSPRGAPLRLSPRPTGARVAQLRAALPGTRLAPVPVQQAPCRPVIVPAGRGPGAARVRGYEPRPRAPPLLRLSNVSGRRPLAEQDAIKIKPAWNAGIISAITML